MAEQSVSDKILDGLCQIDSPTLNYKLPLEGATLTPWVRVTFKNSNTIVTVGNRSSPNNQNHAVIKDFEFGHDDGLECRVTILDEQGSSFVGFMNDMLKDLNCANPKDAYTMDVQFGWFGQDCDQSGRHRRSKVYKIMCREIFANVHGGKFTFEVTGKDITEPQFESKMSQIFYGVNKPIPITEAIRLLFTDTRFPPVVKSVRFLKVPQLTNGEADKFKNIVFKVTNDEKGPLNKWPCNSLNKIDVAHHWLKDYVTVDDKAIRGAYNSEAEGGEVIFWEDLKPNCGQTVDWGKYSLGTYIVNGGKKSSVLEFSTKVKWNFSPMTNVGGGMGDMKVMATDDGKQIGAKDCNTLKRRSSDPKNPNINTAGSMTTANADEGAVANHGKDANKIGAEALDKQLKYLNPFSYGIEAEMTVLGDPLLPRPLFCMWRNVHIIFINPYYIIGGETNQNDVKCGEWLATKPPCNAILTNKAWMVQHVTHRIANGSFTTTFRLRLVAPGIDLNTGEYLGGAGAGAWKPAGCK
jgi:hypothetical protein